MAVLNSTILDKVWLSGTWEYQQRVPQATQAGVAQVAEFLFDPMNKMYLNQFIDILVNRIGMTRILGEVWENPWTWLKKGNLPYGSTVQEIGLQWIKAHSYEDDVTSLLEIHRLEIEAAYYTINRRDQYPISVNYDELRNAFVDEYGLNSLINRITDIPVSSDNYDEFLCMKDLILERYVRDGFFEYTITTTAGESRKEIAQSILEAGRMFAGRFKFPSIQYNMVPVPAFVKDAEKLVFICTPETSSMLDVEALAALFNIEKADLKYRVELIDEWPFTTDGDCQAIITTEDFFQVYDALYTTTSFYNPQTLTTNYYLTHWQVMAYSPFVPAVMIITKQAVEPEPSPSVVDPNRGETKQFTESSEPAQTESEEPVQEDTKKK